MEQLVPLRGFYCVQVHYLSIVGIKERGGPLVGGGKPGGGTVMGNPVRKNKTSKTQYMEHRFPQVQSEQNSLGGGMRGGAVLTFGMGGKNGGGGMFGGIGPGGKKVGGILAGAGSASVVECSEITCRTTHPSGEQAKI